MNLQHLLMVATALISRSAFYKLTYVFVDFIYTPIFSGGLKKADILLKKLAVLYILL